MPNIDHRSVTELLDDVRSDDVMPSTPELYAAAKSEAAGAGQRSARLAWLTQRAQGIVDGTVD